MRRAPFAGLALLAGTLAAVGCGGAKGASTGAGGGPAGAAGTAGAAGSSDAGAGAADAATPAAGMVTVDSCTSLGVGTEPCSYTYQYDPTKCGPSASGGGCSRLVIYFSGGQESCPSPASPISFMAYYAAHGYVAACAMAWQTGAGSGQFPRNREAPRFDALVRAITADPAVRAAWSGKDLLFSGVSHGASGPVIAMARQDYDAQPAWQGTRYTAACFNDGTYDAADLLGFEYTNGCRDLTSVLPYSRSYGRYCPWPASAGGNVVATWPAPTTCDNADTAADTLTDLDVSAFTIADWRLTECGSALDPCTQDVLPADDIQTLCARIDGAPGHHCELGSFPNVSHIQCGIESSSIGACDGWFSAQLAAHGFGG